MYRLPSRNAILFLSVGTVFIFLITVNKLYLRSYGIWGSNNYATKEDLTLKPRTYLNESCAFHKPNPFHTGILKFVNESYMPECKPEYEVVTSLEDGILRIREKEFKDFGEWWYRCLQTVRNREFIAENWIRIEQPASTRPLCDVVEVKAEKFLQKTYIYVHAQIHRHNDTRLSSREAPSVHIIVMDTVSSSNFVRSMKKTRAVMEKELGAIYFPYLNKVGHGSIVNAWSFLFGHRSEPGQETVWGPAFPGSQPDGRKPINPHYIGTVFKEKGYRTLFSEDDNTGLACYNGCKGFDPSPADHWMAAYSARVNYKNESNPELHLFNETQKFFKQFEAACIEPHKALLGTLDKFVNTYSNEAQFSLTWMTKMAHDDLNALYHTDEDFEKFFEKNKEVLKNSFVFLMGDHGTRYGSVTEEPYAKCEDINPTLMITIPESLRDNPEFQSVIKKNAEELISHHDVYASLLDIAKNFNDFSTPSTSPYTPQLHLFGSSFFRPLPQPRNCYTLYIPLQFCMCKNIKRVETNSEMGVKIALEAIQTMNNALINNNLFNLCVKHLLDKESDVRLVEYDTLGVNGERLVVVIFMTYPSKGRYAADAIIQNDNFRITTPFFFRMNAYFWQSFCLDNRDFRDYCYCKDKAREQGVELE